MKTIIQELITNYKSNIIFDCFNGQKVFTISSGCARYIPVYVYISVKGSRVCKPCNVLAVRKYVRVSMV